jgi:hypothetical protein
VQYDILQNAVLTPVHQKAQDRQDVRSESTMQEPAWDFLFEVIYQSLDETDSQDDVDPDTDTSMSEEPKVNTVTRDWITQPPTY